MPLSQQRSTRWSTGRIARWILTGAIVVFLVIFARTIDWVAALSSIVNASPWLLVAALVVNFVSMAIKGIRWWLFLRPAGSPSLGLATRATLAGSGLNNILVANGGDAARVVFVSRAAGLPSSTVLATVALERLFDPVGFVILLVVGAQVYALPPPLARWAVPSQIALAAILALLMWFVYSSRESVTLTHRTTSHLGGFGARVKAYLAAFAGSTRFLTNGRRFAGALGISMLAWIGQVVLFQLAAAAAHVDIPAAGSLVALLATNLGLLVRATPGNVGVFQVAYALAVMHFGVSRNDAIAVSLLIQTLQIAPVTLVGIALAPEFLFKQKARES